MNRYNFVKVKGVVMKLREDIVKEPKGLVYDYFYRSLVYETKDYDNISRKQMVEEIILNMNGKLKS